MSSSPANSTSVAHWHCLLGIALAYLWEQCCPVLLCWALYSSSGGQLCVPPHLQSPRPGSIVHTQLLSFSLECTSPREMTAAKKQHAPVLQAAKSDYNVQNRFPEGRYINFLNYYRLSLRANYRKISFQNTVKNYNLVYRLLCYIFL